MKNADNPDLALWSLWACKETAYKVIKKCMPDVVFIPRRWQTVFTFIQPGYAEGEVRMLENSGIALRLFSNSEHVHCIGINIPGAPDQLTWNVETLPNEETNPSLFSRQCLARGLAERFLLDFHQINIQRNSRNGELQPPVVYVGGHKQDIDVSLSHDGRFVGYVFS